MKWSNFYRRTILVGRFTISQRFYLQFYNENRLFTNKSIDYVYFHEIDS